MPDQTYEMAGDVIVELEKLILKIPENRNYIMVKTDKGAALCPAPHHFFFIYLFFLFF
jgi:hypothetical protein